MKIQNNTNQTAFQAKFLYSNSLKQIADYAVEHGKFEKLNEARKNIDSAYLTTRLKVDIFEKDGKPGVSFTRYTPKKDMVAKSNNDYMQVKQIKYISSTKCNPLKFALERLIRLGNNAPHNNMFRSVVISK